MSHIRQLHDERNAITSEMRSLSDGAGDNALTPEQQTRWDGLRAKSDTLKARIDREILLDDAERRQAGQPIGGTGDNRLDAEVGRFSIVRAIAGQTPGLNVDAGREREVSAELSRRSGRTFEGIAVPLAALLPAPERRALTASGTSDATIGTDLLASEFIDKLWPALAVRRLGARILPGLTGNVAIPKKSASATGYWVADGGAITESDPTLAQITMSVKHAGGLTEFSRSMLLQSSPAIDDLVRADLAALLGQTLDLAAINGSGSSNQPTGVLNTSDIGSAALGTNGGALTYAAVVDLMAAVEEANADGSAMAFLTNPKVRVAALKLTASGTGQPLGEQLVFQNMPRAFTTNVPSTLTKGTSTGVCSALIYGNWSELLIGMWSELDILVNPYESTAYSKGSVQVRAMMSVDISVRHPESFAAITDITTA